MVGVRGKRRNKICVHINICEKGLFSTVGALVVKAVNGVSSQGPYKEKHMRLDRNKYFGPFRGTQNNNDPKVFARRRSFWSEIFAFKFHLQIYVTFFT